MAIVTHLYTLVSRSEEEKNIIDFLNQSFLPKSRISGISLTQTELKQFIKFIYFEDSRFYKIPLKELEDFKEEDLNRNKGNDGEGAGGMDGMMDKLLSSMLGGGDAGGDSGGLAKLLGGGGDGEGDDAQMEQLMKTLGAMGPSPQQPGSLANGGGLSDLLGDSQIRRE
jgi:hypothetical protein